MAIHMQRAKRTISSPISVVLYRLQIGLICLTGMLLLFFTPPALLGQMDQGTITGVVQDPTGAVIPKAQVTLTNVETGLVLKTASDAAGIYIFPPSKVGTYSIRAAAPGFEATVQENVHLNVQDRLNVLIQMRPGGATETVTVTTAPPLLQTEDASVGQVMSMQMVDNTPLNGRNYVYIAQESAGVVSGTGTGSPGAGTGDFVANGQRPEENDYLLDGVENTSGSPNYESAATYAVRPPPDALSEFKIQTADFSAQFGHSAGAVINASIKSGTNDIHGDLWEYVRNNIFDAQDWDATSVQTYRENQFGATLGLPILRNKLFFFGYAENNRIVYYAPIVTSVPTTDMRAGNFSELLNPALTSSGAAITLYEPNSAGTVPLTCSGQSNVFCTGQIDTVAQNILKMYPSPNANDTKVFDNYTANLPTTDNTWNWGTRVDYNLSAKDQVFARFSYMNEEEHSATPLGSVLDGVGANPENKGLLSEDFTMSETHIFNSTFFNEFRVGYLFGNYAVFQINDNTDLAPTLGLGGVPFGPQIGGLPYAEVAGINLWGSADFLPNHTRNNNYQIMDNLTKIYGRHSLTFGVAFESNRYYIIAPPYARGLYDYTADFTSKIGASNTGYGVADFLADDQNSGDVSTVYPFNKSRWYRSGYFEDHWRVLQPLTINLGLRYDDFQPQIDQSGGDASFQITSSPLLPAAGTGILVYPKQDVNVPLNSTFTNDLSANNVSIQYSGNPGLTAEQFTNFAPRVGFAYSLPASTVIRGGFGIFYGGLEGTGAPDYLENYPFQFSSSFTSPSCTVAVEPCKNDGISLENGFQTQLNAGLYNSVSQPVLYGIQPQSHTPYTESFNLTVEKSLRYHMAASVGYVGALGRHQIVAVNLNNTAALVAPGLSATNYRPFPALGAATITMEIGESSYNALQAHIEKRFSDGLYFLATYTWAHSLDDAVGPFSSSQDAGFRAPDMIGITHDYSNSISDIRQRVTFDGFYDLPFGAGRHYKSHLAAINTVLGGWSSDVQYQANTGLPFTVSTNEGSSALPPGVSVEAVPIHNPFAAGGTPDPSINVGGATVTCATATRTKTHWYNPCAFANPPLTGLTGTPNLTTGANEIVGLAALPYLGGRRNDVAGPGWGRLNMSLFKNVRTFREQRLQLRADAFNVLNTPDYGSPSQSSDASTGGLITTPRTFQNLTPDARFFQLSGKYTF
jgi:Carboxypeptidase regulatory-like domain